MAEKRVIKIQVPSPAEKEQIERAIEGKIAMISTDLHKPDDAPLTIVIQKQVPPRKK